MEALDGPVDEVAPLLLGGVLRHGRVALAITEVEAYGGADDPGSHAYRGRTARNAVMFGASGRLYVYFTYGMHHCANVSAGPEGTPSAVLIRAGRVVEGRDLAAERRPGSSVRDLARGPARLCRALDLDRGHDGDDLTPGTPGPVLELRDPVAPGSVRTGPRVGLRHAAERAWRFWLDGEASVSTYRPAAPRKAR